MLTVAAHAPFDVALASAPSTGYMWEPLALPDGVTLLTTRFSQKAEAAIGDGGSQVFALQAQQPGRLQLRFVLKRRWEQTPVETRLIEVDVT
jgi:predicted secreted protein